jgi:hypothetical protein
VNVKLKSLAQNAIRPIRRHGLTVNRHSPALLLGAGILSVGTTVYLACKATTKLPDVIEETEKKVDALNELIAADGGSNKALERQRFRIKVKAAGKVARLYAPAAVLGIVSVGTLTGSHVILQRRNASIAAAYGVLNKTFKDYRARVVDAEGSDKDLEYMYGTVEVDVVEETETGPVVTRTKKLDLEKVKENSGRIYDRVFEETNPNYVKPRALNIHKLQQWELLFNDRLRLVGYVFLNEVYKELGFEETRASRQVGWLKNPGVDEHGNPMGDGYISFGIGDPHSGGDYMMRGDETQVLLTFNVDGPILNALPRA